MAATRAFQYLVATVAFMAVASGCVRNPYRVDVSGIDPGISVTDLGGEIFNTPPPDLSAKADSLLSEHGDMMRTFSMVTGLGDTRDPAWKASFIMFATDLQNLALWDDVRKVWPDYASLTAGLDDAFRHYLYYFPSKTVPQTAVCITAFNNSIIVDDSLLMISLDRYLGKDCKYYPSIGIYSYQARKMTPDYAVPDAVYSWASTEWDYHSMNYGARNLLNSMLHEAKLVYFTRRMMPDLADTVLFGFTGKQLDFCTQSESRMWEYLLSNDLLFSTDAFVIRKFTGEAPFTSYFTEDSPGRAIVWTGYRIVERFMKNNPKVTMAELMGMTDCQAILTGAKYSPD